MKILLDTHILLWAVSNDSRLTDKARNLIEDEENDIYYSVISLWEVEIKHLLHPEALSLTAEDLYRYCTQSGFQKLTVTEKHIFYLEKLKLKENALPHKDPFDRMLICQASTENMVFMTHDTLIPGYDEACIFHV